MKYTIQPYIECQNGLEMASYGSLKKCTNNEEGANRPSKSTLNLTNTVHFLIKGDRCVAVIEGEWYFAKLTYSLSCTKQF